jgi:hypothetical protein
VDGGHNGLRTSLDGSKGLLELGDDLSDLEGSSAGIQAVSVIIIIIVFVCRRGPAGNGLEVNSRIRQTIFETEIINS